MVKQGYSIFIPNLPLSLSHISSPFISVFPRMQTAHLPTRSLPRDYKKAGTIKNDENSKLEYSILKRIVYLSYIPLNFSVFGFYFDRDTELRNACPGLTITPAKMQSGTRRPSVPSCKSLDPETPSVPGSVCNRKSPQFPADAIAISRGLGGVNEPTDNPRSRWAMINHDYKLISRAATRLRPFLGSRACPAHVSPGFCIRDHVLAARASAAAHVRSGRIVSCPIKPDNPREHDTRYADHFSKFMQAANGN